MKKLSTTAICNIRHSVNIENQTRVSLAQKYSVSSSTISDIANGRTYRNIPEAKVIPGFNNYLVYPNGRVWSFNANRFVKSVTKSSRSTTKYINLRSGEARRSMQVSQLVSSLF